MAKSVQDIAPFIRVKMASAIAPCPNWYHLALHFPQYQITKEHLRSVYGNLPDFQIVEHMLNCLASLCRPVSELRAALESLGMLDIVNQFSEDLTDLNPEPQAANGHSNPAPCAAEDLDYLNLSASGQLKKLSVPLLEQIQWLWHTLSQRDLAFVNVGGDSIEESIANAFLNLPGTTYHAIANGTILEVFHNFAQANFIEVELYYIHNSNGTASLGCKTVGKPNGLIYRFCILPTGQCTIVVGGHARELQLWEKRHARLSKVHELVSNTNGSDALSKQFIKDYHSLYKKRMEEELVPTIRPLVAVVGNPSVGKSTLINQILGAGTEKIVPAYGCPDSVTAFPSIISYADINGYEVSIDYLHKEDILSMIKVYKKSAADSPSKSDTKFLQLLKFKDTTLSQAEKLDLLEKSMTNDSVESFSHELADIVQQIRENKSASEKFETSDKLQAWFYKLSNQKRALIQKATIRTRNDALKSTDLADLPGLNDIQTHRSKRTIEFLDKCHLLLFIFKDRLDQAHYQVYSTLSSLQKPMAVIYTHFFQLKDMNDLMRNESVRIAEEGEDSEIYHVTENALPFLVAKHFHDTKGIRDAAKAASVSNNSQITHVPLITVDSGWSQLEANVFGEPVQVPQFLSNVNTIKLYFQSIANKYIKEHSDRMAHLMQEWLLSIKTSRKEPILSEVFVNSVLTKQIYIKHNFPTAVVSKKTMDSIFQISINKNIQCTQRDVLSMFKTSNGQYVRGVAWRSIVDDAYYNVDGWFGLNSAYARFTANLFRESLVSVLTDAASNLAHAVDDYISEAICKLNKDIAAKLNQSKEKIHMEATLSQASALKISKITVDAQKYLAGANNFFARVVSRVADNKYYDALEDGGSGVVKRVSAELSDTTFVKVVVQSMIDDVANIFLPEFFNTLKDAAAVILSNVTDDTRKTFLPLTVGTPVTLEDILAQENFREIIELLYDIDRDAQSLN